MARVKTSYSDNPYVDIAVLKEKIDNIENEFSGLKIIIKELSDEIKNINNIANRAKGVFFIILTMGAIISGIITLVEKVWKYLH